MAILSDAQRLEIVKYNPHKKLIAKGREMNNHLMLHLHGIGLEDCAPLARDDYFENEGAYKSRMRRPVSNKDLMSRVLQEEDQVFTARGGSSNYGLSKKKEDAMGELLDNVRYGHSLREWVRNFALNAYRADPMGVIFVEIDVQGKKAYPTYKSIQDIYDYHTTGRKLEYICFNIPRSQFKVYGIPEEQVNPDQARGEAKKSQYYRFVDDAQDLIVKYENDRLVDVGLKGKNPIKNTWKKVPGFIVSDLIQFNDTDLFGSPLQFVVELADEFLADRSVRNLQKKFHGFAKAVEPLLKCPTCQGTGVIEGTACPDCTPSGASQGTGYKLQTKVGDIAKFPLDILEKGSFDFNKIFGYVVPPIDSLKYMDLSLDQAEQLIYYTYWGVARDPVVAKGPTEKNGAPDTATEIKANLKPKYARLNTTADWAEGTEKMIADFIGLFAFPGFKEAQIAYGRSYILETPNDLIQQYYDMRTKGAPDFLLDEQLAKYIRALYQNSPVQMQKYLKLLEVEPFPHMPLAAAQTAIPNPEDYNAKVYFGEWYSTVPDTHIVSTPAPKLREELREYVKAKNIPKPEPEPVN